MSHTAPGVRPAAADVPTLADRTTVADLLALRALTKRPTAGIELHKLNEGERKRRKQKKKDDGGGPKTTDELWQEQMQRGGLVANPSAIGSRGGAQAQDSDDEDAVDASGNKVRKLVRQNNFQGETGTVDVDKHMMAYIEQEMAKRRREAAKASSSSTTADIGELSSTALRNKLIDPNDELFRIAEQYKDLQKKPQITEREEGNVTLSAAMLSSIPEYDLGMEAKLKNIEETERAKRKLFEERKAAGKGRAGEDDNAYASARFMRSGRLLDSDSTALRNAKLEAQGLAVPPPPQRNEHRQQLASDQIVMDRFKKRQANQSRR